VTARVTIWSLIQKDLYDAYCEYMRRRIICRRIRVTRRSPQIPQSREVHTSADMSAFTGRARSPTWCIAAACLSAVAGLSGMDKKIRIRIRQPRPLCAIFCPAGPNIPDRPDSATRPPVCARQRWSQSACHHHKHFGVPSAVAMKVTMIFSVTPVCITTDGNPPWPALYMPMLVQTRRST
jgi:hypothetical protein